MPRIAHFIRIDAPVERVFAFLADPTNIPRIQTEFRSVRLLTPPPAGIGATIEAQGTFRGLPLTVQMQIVAFDPPHLLVSDSSGMVQSRTTWQVAPDPPPDAAPVAPPLTRVTLSIDYSVTIPGLAFLGSLVQRDLDGLTSAALRRLKALVESGK
ncbi:MAG: SRPBCC family protein [Chloroflexota bacterium]|nr:SRPBCC family protein [Chloroflexota bacterium]